MATPRRPKVGKLYKFKGTNGQCAFSWRDDGKPDYHLPREGIILLVGFSEEHPDFFHMDFLTPNGEVIEGFVTTGPDGSTPIGYFNSIFEEATP